MTHSAALSRPTLALSFVIAGALFSTGCSRGERSAPRPTQAALGTAISTVTQPSASEQEREDARHRAASERAPSMRMQSGALSVTADEDHVDAHATRSGAGWAVTWGDRAHERAFMLLTDGQGAVRAAPVLVRQATSEEEEVYPPDVVATSNGYALAWTDPSNGRVRFARLDTSRRPVGRARIVHDGLESPRTTRLASNANEHGIAVQLDHGVYFARVNAEGARVGQGVLLSEDAAIAAIESVRSVGSSFEVRWREESGAVRSASISREGQVALRTHADPGRVASR
jgi:hypothetical protein